MSVGTKPKRQKKVEVEKDKEGTYKTTSITRRSGKKITKKKLTHIPKSGKKYTYKTSKSTKTNKKGQKVEKNKDAVKLKSKPLNMAMNKEKKVDGELVKKRQLAGDKKKVNKRKTVVKKRKLSLLRD